jgi:hypothetical protein
MIMVASRYKNTRANLTLPDQAENQQCFSKTAFSQVTARILLTHAGEKPHMLTIQTTPSLKTWVLNAALSESGGITRGQATP